MFRAEDETIRNYGNWPKEVLAGTYTRTDFLFLASKGRKWILPTEFISLIF